MHASVTVVPHDREWARRCAAEAALLRPVLAPWLAGGIHHVGSTAIPGLAAKPIVDLMAGVGDLEQARAAYTPLREHGYVHAPHRPGITHHFSKPSLQPDEMQFGLHLTEPGSDLWRERLAFRDALRADAGLAAAYAALKTRLAREHEGDVEAYTAGKRAFVAGVLDGAGLRHGRRCPPTRRCPCARNR